MRVGFFGGSFDPVHNGHLVVASTVRDALDLDVVRFSPTARPPHKSRRMVDIAHRVDMVRAAIARHAWAVCDEGETGNETSYTVDSLRRLEAADRNLFLVLGGDSFDDLHTWRSPEEIVRLATLAVYRRPGDALAASWPHVTVDGPLVEISSSEIRRRIARGHSLAGWVPDAVATVIEERQLYGGAR